MRCPKCQFENREEAKFCSECGYKFEITCPKCGNKIRFGSKFCDECGENITEPLETPSLDYTQPQSYTPKFLADKILNNRSSIEGERKLVTVLFADVAEYTSMAEKLDPEEVHEIMDGCFKILMDKIHSYEGTINQFTGDGVMALFGAPVAHEDHAQRACHAALSIQKAIAEYGKDLKNSRGCDFKMRIGLNSGPVIVGSIGDNLRMDYTAVGDTTNLAARMEGMANPGTILGTGNTHKLTKDFFEFKALGKVLVKGKEEPVEAHELKKATEIETRIEAATAKGLTKFVGRKNSMSTLMGAYDKAKSGFGQVVGIVGEAGVGKSRLLIELRNVLSKEEVTYLEGRCLHYGGSMAYLPVHDILKTYFDIKEEDQEPVINKKMKEKISPFDARLKSALPPFQDLLSVRVEDDAYLQLEPTTKKIRTFEAIRDLVVCESEDKPVIFVVEDLHWIDSISEEFLKYLIDWLAGTHILLIILYRPEYTHQWGSKSFYSKIGVDQLTTKSGAQLVHNILEGGEVVPELRELICNRAGGNPLFVEELAHSLLENGSIQRQDNQYVLTKLVSDIEVPDTIQGIIAARMDRIEESLKHIMQMASVIGREFAYRILQTIMGMREELKSSLINLQGLELIYEKSLFPELEYIFKHALTHEVAYNSLLVKRRKEIHEKVGGAIEDLYPDRLKENYEILAYHYGQSDNKDKALEYFDLANRKAYHVSAMEEANAYFYKIMNLLDAMPDTKENKERRISLLVKQNWVFSFLFKYKEYFDLLTRYKAMTVELENQEILGGFYVMLGSCEGHHGKLDKSNQTLTKAVELCEASGNIKYARHAYLELIESCLYMGDFDQVLALGKKALKILDSTFDPYSYVYTVSIISWAYSYIGRWDRAVEECQKALNIAEKLSNNSLISFASHNIAYSYIQKGDIGRAVEYSELAFEMTSTPSESIFSMAPLGWALCRAGETSKGLDLLSQLLQMIQADLYLPFEVEVRVMLGEGYRLAEEFEKSRQTLEEALDLAAHMKMNYFIGWSNRLLGDIAIITNLNRAAAHFDKSVHICKKIGAENELAFSFAGYGRLHKHQGNIAEARGYFEKALEIFERFGTLIEPEKIRKELAELPEA